MAAGAALLTPALLLTGDTPRGEVVQTGPSEYFVRPGGGEFWLRYTPGVDGQWQSDGLAYFDANTARGFVALSDEERARIGRPITTPILPPAGPSGPPPTVVPPERDPSPPPTTATPQPPPPPLVNPVIDPPSIEDLVIQATHVQNNRDLAQERYRNHPNLANPSSLAGTGVPGVCQGKNNCVPPERSVAR